MTWIDWLNDSRWMQSPNVKVILYAALAALPCLIADASSDHFGWTTIMVAFGAALGAVKAFMSNPSSIEK